MQAKIVKGASNRYFKEINRQFNPRCGPPKTYMKYGELLKEYEGVTMKIDRQYGRKPNRGYVLTYPVAQGNVTGIDVEEKYIEVI